MSDEGDVRLPPEAVEAVCRHMNDDHAEDCRTIVRGLAGVEAERARMTGLDGRGARFEVEARGERSEVLVAWVSPPADRAGVRVEVVRLLESARAALGPTDDRDGAR
jgi:hypothetical protein